MSLSQKTQDELRAFIVDSNLEGSLLSQLNDKATKREIMVWLGMVD